MLKRLYIDNYRCLSNFEWRPGARVLLAGRNGSGKSAVLHVLWSLHRFLVHQSTTDSLFPPQTLTAWDRRDKQTIEMTIGADDQEYGYRLVVEHDNSRRQSRIFHERLSVGDRLLYEYKDGEAHLYRDNGTSGPSFPTDWSRSLISTLPGRQDNKQLIAFRDRMRRIHLFALKPWSMISHSEREERDPYPDLSNLSSWLRHLQIEDSSFPSRLTESLVPLFPGFIGYGMTAGVGDGRSLVFRFSPPGVGMPEYKVPLDELSDGQRALTALHIILHSVVQRDTTICFDEPDNFISLREIQPWLLQLEDRQEETGCQCLFISHHPEVIDLLTPMEETVLLERDNGGVVRLKPFAWGESDGVSASELMARGWESDG